MVSITVSLANALMCFAGHCYPVLIGKDTPTGEFEVRQALTSAAGYGGDVLIYKETERDAWAIHRTYSRDRLRDRSKLYNGTTPEQRKITGGCINVQPAVYEELLEAGHDDGLELIITE